MTRSSPMLYGGGCLRTRTTLHPDAPPWLLPLLHEEASGGFAKHGGTTSTAALTDDGDLRRQIEEEVNTARQKAGSSPLRSIGA
jgi:hypothetical protein